MEVSGRLGRVEGGRDLLSDERGIQILDGSLAVAAHAERIGHVSRTVLAKVKRVFAVVRVVRVSIWHDHLGKRNAPEHLLVMSDMLFNRFAWTCR